MAFLEDILDTSEENAFLKDFLPFQKKIAHYGMLNSLSQELIKITSPGIPDLYQGTELWDLSLVDPDNRRPVNFERRIALLQYICNKAATDLPGLVSELLSDVRDGRIKLFLVNRALNTRKNAPLVFEKGDYIALKTIGRFERNVIAFASKFDETWAITIAPRFLCAVVGEGDFPLGTRVWEDTRVILPGRSPSMFRNALTDEIAYGGDSLAVGDVLRPFPWACSSVRRCGRSYNSEHVPKNFSKSLDTLGACQYTSASELAVMIANLQQSASNHRKTVSRRSQRLRVAHG